jgi:DNA mismatch repair protein MutS2
VPVHESSSFGIFSEILLDIGDTQSIEDDLSTYSAHLSAMRSFVQRAGKRTLVLIDEFGKGTEPQFGGAMAEAILERLAKEGCYGVITTHYQNLKDLANRTKGLINGAMKYDLNKLEPLFQLEIGKPGSSFAFEIAAKIGLPKELVDAAKQKVGKDQVDFDKSLNNLQREKQKYDKLVGKLEKEQAAVQKIRKDYEELKEMLDEERKEMIRAAKQEAKRIVQDANKEVERAIREIKESQADKAKTMQARKRLENESAKLKVEERTIKKKKAGISVGDQVRMNGHEGVGEIIRLKDKEAEVQFGLMKSFVKLDRLEKVSGPRKEQATSRSKGYNRLDKMMTFKHELVIRGMRAEEALPTLDTFVDEAILLGMDQVKVIHGKGHGILRDLLRNHLSRHPHIAKIEDDHADRGGSGISIVTFK